MLFASQSSCRSEKIRSVTGQAKLCKPKPKKGLDGVHEGEHAERSVHPWVGYHRWDLRVTWKNLVWNID